VPQYGINVCDSPMEQIVLSQTEVICTLKTGEFYRFDTLYMALGTAARTDLLAGLSLRLFAGHIDVAQRHRTSMKRPHAIGDITEGLDQIAVAMSQVAIAATTILNDLIDTVAGVQV
jgi:thioredoxin reductase (NADPH)